MTKVLSKFAHLAGPLEYVVSGARLPCTCSTPLSAKGQPHPAQLVWRFGGLVVGVCSSGHPSVIILCNQRSPNVAQILAAGRGPSC